MSNDIAKMLTDMAGTTLAIPCPQATGGAIQLRTAGKSREYSAIYPVTIAQARYSGSYEGAPWLCFPCYPEALTRELDPPGMHPARREYLNPGHYRGWDGSDIGCMQFWQEARDEGWLIGYGGTPTAAYEDLIRRCLAAADA